MDLFVWDFGAIATSLNQITTNYNKICIVSVQKSLEAAVFIFGDGGSLGAQSKFLPRCPSTA